LGIENHSDNDRPTTTKHSGCNWATTTIDIVRGVVSYLLKICSSAAIDAWND